MAIWSTRLSRRVEIMVGETGDGQPPGKKTTKDREIAFRAVNSFQLTNRRLTGIKMPNLQTGPNGAVLAERITLASPRRKIVLRPPMIFAVSLPFFSGAIQNIQGFGSLGRGLFPQTPLNSIRSPQRRSYPWTI